MKLSQRDKVIFLAVIAFLVILLGGVTIVKPKFTEKQNTAVTLETKEQEKIDVDAKIDTLEPKKDQLKKAVESVEELQERFVPHIESFEVEPMLFDIIKESKITIDSDEITLMTENELKNYVYAKDAVAYDMRMDADLNGELPQEVLDRYNQVKAEAPAGVKVGLTIAAVGFSGPFEDLLAALDNVIAEDKTIIVTALEGKSSDARGDEASSEEGPTGILTIYVFHIEHMAELTD